MTWADRCPVARLVAHAPEWADQYAELAATLGRALGPEWEMEHVGSTSVPDLVAKPVIDLALRMPAGACVEDASAALVCAGWSELVVVGDHWCTFLLVDRVRSAIGHVFDGEQWAQAHVRLFAEWLRRHEADRVKYADLKKALVSQGSWGDGYTAAKSAFVRDIVNRARAARGLPPVQGPL